MDDQQIAFLCLSEKIDTVEFGMSLFKLRGYSKNRIKRIILKQYKTIFDFNNETTVEEVSNLPRNQHDYPILRPSDYRVNCLLGDLRQLINNIVYHRISFVQRTGNLPNPNKIADSKITRYRKNYFGKLKLVSVQCSSGRIRRRRYRHGGADHDIDF